MRRMLLCLGTGGLFLACPAVVIAQNVIIKCTRPCSSVIQAVESNGGVVTYRYRYVDAIAADLRGTQALNAVRQVVEPGELRKDFEVALPPTDGRTGSIPPALNVEAGPGAPLDAGMLAETVAEPNAYLINNLAMNLAPLHGNQILGQGMKVAVIDSGLRPNFPHLTLDGSVIGGEDFVGDGLGYNNAANSGHGTFVAGMISANVAFTIGGALRTAIATYCPSCVLPASPTTSVLPVVGSAPSSSIYAIRIFGPIGGAPGSRLSGDWTNASPIGATIAVSSQKTKTPGKSAHGKIEDGETFEYTFNVPAGTARLEVELEWDNDWGAYPTNDIDLALQPPTGAPILDGATINAPERAGINNPVAGEWTAIVDGFSVLTKHGDKFSLRLMIDGKVLRLKPGNLSTTP